MSIEIDHSDKQSKPENLDAQTKGDATGASKMVSEVYAPHEAAAASGKTSAPTVESQKGQTDGANHKELPSLAITGGKAFEPLPWNQPPTDEGRKLHMSYQMQKDSLVKIGEGPHHVAKRLLGGKSAAASDVNSLTTALVDQYKEEHPEDKGLNNLRIGHSIINEGNIGQVLDRISDQSCRERIQEQLKIGWNDEPQPTAIPFDHDARPGETQPSSIPDAAVFLKDLAAAAIDVHAADLRAKGQCAAGARLALNELPLWHIDGGSVDKSINKDPNGWRGGVKMAQDLSTSGLFDEVPLSKIGVNGLKEGYIVGRYHFPDYVKKHPTWGGEDLGDIDIVTSKHRPEADGRIYKDSFVLIPKKPAKS